MTLNHLSITSALHNVYQKKAKPCICLLLELFVLSRTDGTINRILPSTLNHYSVHRG